MDWIKLAARFFGTYLKCQIEYRASFYGDIIANLITYIIQFLTIWVLLEKFHQIQGWSFYEVVFIFNLNLFTYGIAGFILWYPMQSLGDFVRQGLFDHVLTKPMNPLLYLVLSRPGHTFIAHTALGIIVFFICFTNLHIEWNFEKGLFFVLVIIGATLIHLAVFIVTGTTSFWTIRSWAIMSLMIYTFRGFVNYPINVFGKLIQVIMTFIVPYAFLNFYPVHYFLNKGNETLFHPALQYGTPVVGIVLFLVAYKFWTIGINRYESTGS